MLPYFNVALAETFRMPRKRNVDVPVHRGNSETSQPIHKTFSANFNSRRKQKTVEFADTQTFEQDNNAHINDEPEKETKITKKSLCKEIERLSDENAVLLERLAGAESVCSKKIARMREKVMTLQDYYEQLQTENGNLKAKHQELLDAYEGVKAQLKIDKQCESCEQLKKIVEKGNEEYNLLRSNNKDLLDDISMLKNVVYRLNVQMERYQDKLRKSNVRHQLPSAENTNNPETLYCVEQQQQVLSDHADHGHTPISWGKVNAHTLGPLLDSYQETIEEKDDVIASYEKELSNFTGRIKEILSENEALHRRLTDDDQCSKKLTEELETARAELKGAKEQNDILIKKCALKQDKVEEILRCYEQKVDQLQRDYKVVHEEYIRSRSEIVALKEKNKALLEAKEDFKHEKENYIPLSVHAASINECKRLYEELKVQYEKEKSKLEENICSQNREMLELNNKISSLAKEKEELENKIKNLDKHVKKSEAKYLELQQTVKEIQISRTACRKQLHKAMTFAKDLVLEQETLLKALNQRHQENKVVKKLGTDIATRMDTLKSQLKNVQRDAWQELTTVEQRLQDQNSLIDTMKQEHSEEVERLKEIIRRKETDGAGNEPSSIPIPHYLLLRDRHT